MTTLEEAERTRRLNILDMGLTFTAMLRVFEPESKAKILKKLDLAFISLEAAKTKDEFEKIHIDFCKWFEHSIKTASKSLRNKSIKPSGPASFGHGAKVFDIVAKVFFYYSSLPTLASSKQLLPFLHGAIDNPILKRLKERFPTTRIAAESIEAIDQTIYECLQTLITKHIAADFGKNIIPVQYDDIQWMGLNRK